MDNLNSLELRIAKLLRAGVLLAGAFLLVGWLAGWLWATPDFSSFAEFHEQPLRDSVHADWAAGRWDLLTCYMGLLVLILLPLTRVMLTVPLFLRNSEWLMAAAAGFVTVALLTSFFLGFSGL
jgi:uncharacterized membrane protein